MRPYSIYSLSLSSFEKVPATIFHYSGLYSLLRRFGLGRPPPFTSTVLWWSSSRHGGYESIQHLFMKLREPNSRIVGKRRDVFLNSRLADTSVMSLKNGRTAHLSKRASPGRWASGSYDTKSIKLFVKIYIQPFR